MKPLQESATVSHGVEELISRLRDEGVEAGRSKAEAICSQAESDARKLLESARGEADAIRAAAKDEAARTKRSTEDALRAAMGQIVLELRGQLLERFSSDIRRLVSEAMHDGDLIRRLILEVAAGARDSAGVAPGEAVEALLPASFDDHDLRHDLEALRESPLTQLVLARTSQILREGVTLGTRVDNRGGLILRLREGDVEIELSPDDVAQVLLSHLQPRFRAIFDGVIR